MCHFSTRLTVCQSAQGITKASNQGVRSEDRERKRSRRSEGEMRQATATETEKERKSSARCRSSAATKAHISAGAQPRSGPCPLENRAPQGPLAGWVEVAKNIVHKAVKHKSGWPFLQPVDPIALELPDYFDVIQDPMDLSTIENRLHKATRHGGYSSHHRFADDMRLVFQNALTYNDEGDPVWKHANVMSAFFESEWAQALDALAAG